MFYPILVAYIFLVFCAHTMNRLTTKKSFDTPIQWKSRLGYCFDEIFIVTVWGTVASPNFMCMSVCLSVCPNLMAYKLYLGYYKSDFKETWWIYWNLDPIDCFKIS